MAYLCAELTSLSSIIAIAVCGMVMKQYIKGNITPAATHSVKYFTKMLSQSSETVIFMFLGLSTISSAHYWDTWFVVFTIFFCLLWRTIGVIVQCWILNMFRHKKFTKVDQFVLSYGGLRGAIAFGLAVSIPESIVAKPMFITTTIVVIYFTVFLQGVTIRPLVKFLNVETQENRQKTMTESVYNKYLMYMMSGLEEIAGLRGHYSFTDRFERFNAKILRPILMRHEEKSHFDASTIVRAYNKITLEDAMNISKKSKTEEQDISELIKKRVRIADVEETVEQGSSGEIKSSKTDELYAIFSDLLERKLREMQAVKELEEQKEDEDIPDDYMKKKELREKEDEEEREHRTPEEGLPRQRKNTAGGSRKKSAAKQFMV